jgi:hypothetical protein
MPITHRGKTIPETRPFELSCQYLGGDAFIVANVTSHYDNGVWTLDEIEIVSVAIDFQRECDSPQIGFCWDWNHTSVEVGSFAADLRRRSFRGGLKKWRSRLCDITSMVEEAL